MLALPVAERPPARPALVAGAAAGEGEVFGRQARVDRLRAGVGAVVVLDHVGAQGRAVVMAGVEVAAVGAAPVPDHPPGRPAVDVLAEPVVQELALDADLGQLIGLGPAELAPEDQTARHAPRLPREPP